MRVLGIDLAITTGFALVDVFDQPVFKHVLAGNETFREFHGDLFGSLIKGWSVHLLSEMTSHHYEELVVGISAMDQTALYILVTKFHNLFHDLQSDYDAVCVESPEFLLGFHRNKRGDINRASSEATIHSMLKLKYVVEVAWGWHLSELLASKEYGTGKPVLRWVSGERWQHELLKNMPVPTHMVYTDGGRRTRKNPLGIKEKMPVTKAQSIMGSWYHLGAILSDHNISDAAMIAVWGGLHRNDPADWKEYRKRADKKKKGAVKE